MEMEFLLKNIKKRKALVFGIMIGAFILMAAITFVQPLKYSVTSRLLISQNLSGADPYTVSKSNQYLSNLFAQVAHSSSFFTLTTNTGFNIDKSYFGNDYKKQMKTWNKTIEARSIGDTGIIEILIYHPNTYQAQQIALAVNQVLINQSSNYQKGGNDVTITVIDQPLTSSYPVKPNIILNIIFALILGSATSIFYIYFFPAKTQRYIKIKENKIAAEQINYPPNNLPTTEQIQFHQNHNSNTENIRGNINNILR